MPVSNIYGNALMQPKSVQDFDNEAMQAQQSRMALQTNALALQDRQRAATDQVTLRNALMGLGANVTDDQRIQALKNTGLPGGFTQADALEKAGLERQKTQAEGKYKAAQTDQVTLQTDQDRTKFALQKLAGANDPQSALMVGLQSGLVKPEDAGDYYKSIPKDQEGYMKWRTDQMNTGVDLAKQIELKQQALLAGNVQAGENARTAATNAAHLKGIGIQQGGENTRASLTRQQQLMMAGMKPDGGPSEGLEAEAQLIAAGKAAPPSGMAATRPQTAMLMKRVQEINPEYDATSYLAKVKAAKDFGSGTQGNSMRSFAVAGQHLDQLGTLVDALNNGNLQIVNKIGNAYAQQTGSPAPTNFDAAKDVVSKEVIKAIVAGGGGVSEREELSKLMSNAKSPAQLKGVITQYRSLMGAQHDALLQQRRAAGLPDSTLPNYTDANGSPDTDLHSKADAILRGGK